MKEADKQRLEANLKGLCVLKFEELRSIIMSNGYNKQEAETMIKAEWLK
jgi:hypothetical protein